MFRVLHPIEGGEGTIAKRSFLPGFRRACILAISCQSAGSSSHEGDGKKVEQTPPQIDRRRPCPGAPARVSTRDLLNWHADTAHNLMNDPDFVRGEEERESKRLKVQEEEREPNKVNVQAPEELPVFDDLWLGVYAHSVGSRVRYDARIKIHSKPITIGTFDTPEEAAHAYDDYASKIPDYPPERYNYDYEKKRVRYYRYGNGRRSAMGKFVRKPLALKEVL